MRLSESDLRVGIAQPNGRNYEIVRALDRFGDYGLIGLLIYRFTTQSLVVEDWALSCRALGRGVEERIVTHLGNIGGRSPQDIVFAYKDTKRNRAASEFFLGAGCTLSQDGQSFVLSTNDAVGCLERAERRWARHSPGSERMDGSTAEASDPRHREPWSADLIKIARELHGAEEILAAIDRARRPIEKPSGVQTELHSNTERVLGEIWSELLNVNAVSREDNFFELGGDSILAVRLLSEIRRRLLVEIEPTVFFTGELSIAQLSTAVEAAQNSERGSSALIV